MSERIPQNKLDDGEAAGVLETVPKKGEVTLQFKSGEALKMLKDIAAHETDETVYNPPPAQSGFFFGGTSKFSP